jgi:hypothetical protein
MKKLTLNKEFLHMQKLAGLITEGEYKQKLNEKTLSPEEQKVLDDITSTLNEGMFDDVIEKVKSYAKKELLTTAILTSLIALPNFSNAQQQQIKQAAQIETSSQQDMDNTALFNKVITLIKQNPNKANEWIKKDNNKNSMVGSIIQTQNMQQQNHKDSKVFGGYLKNEKNNTSTKEFIKFMSSTNPEQAQIGGMNFR